MIVPVQAVAGHLELVASVEASPERRTHPLLVKFADELDVAQPERRAHRLIERAERGVDGAPAAHAVVSHEF